MESELVWRRKPVSENANALPTPPQIRLAQTAFIIRRFDRVSARNLLDLQCQLTSITTELDALDEESWQVNRSIDNCKESENIRC
jgi:hypothetical protein